jgi:hypothetical protein
MQIKRTVLTGVHLKLSFFVNALRATVLRVMRGSTDINALPGNGFL